MITRLCHINDCVENYTRGYVVNTPGGGMDVFLIVRHSEIHIYANHCPHTGSTLDWGNDRFLDPEGEFIQCAQHGALFEIATGACVYGPCYGQSLSKISHSVVNRWVCVSL